VEKEVVNGLTTNERFYDVAVDQSRRFSHTFGGWKNGVTTSSTYKNKTMQRNAAVQQ
jgi:hypothetical protein